LGRGRGRWKGSGRGEKRIWITCEEKEERYKSLPSKSKAEKHSNIMLFYLQRTKALLKSEDVPQLLAQ